MRLLGWATILSFCLNAACAKDESGDADGGPADAMQPAEDGRAPLPDAQAPVDVSRSDRPSAADANGGGPGFPAVQKIFDKSCTTCHDAAKKGLQAEIPLYPELSLTADAAYQNIVGKPGLETCGGPLVTPGDSNSSYLLHKLKDDRPCDGMRMPISTSKFIVVGMPPVTLPPEDIATIQAWIDAGASR